MTTDVAEAPAASTSPQLAGIIDSDVELGFADDLKDLHDYFPRTWQERLGSANPPGMNPRYRLPAMYLYDPPMGAVEDQPDRSTELDPVAMAREHLDAHGIAKAVLVPKPLLGLGAFPDVDIATQVASAYNDWLCERWLAADLRFHGAAVVAADDPARAVKELDRVAGRAGIASVLLPLPNRALGERQYYPIYEAAQRHSLPVTIHLARTESMFVTAPGLSMVPANSAEWQAALPQVLQSNMVSLVCYGVFERFPELKVLFVGAGFGWPIEPMWRLDRDWQGLRSEVPWVKRPPSEYIRRNIRFTTGPLPEPHKPEYLADQLEMIHADQTLIFGSHYPGAEWEDQLTRMTDVGVSPALSRRILVDGPAELYGDRLR